MKFTEAQYITALARARAQGITLKKRARYTVEQGAFYATSSDGTTVYMVNARAHICSCQAGQKGLFCKHLAAGIAAMRAARLPRIIERTPRGPVLSNKRALVR